MIQALRPLGLHYGLRRLAGPADARVPRPQQSAAAAQLLADLRADARLEAGPSSKAHSRAWAVAAIAAEGRVGIDIEYCSKDRPIAAIASWLMKEAVADAAMGWRVFTFYEAYFKAMGAAPSAALMRDAARANADQFVLADVTVLHAMPAGGVTMTLVWTGPFETASFSGV